MIEITVFTPAYNRAKTLKKAYESLEKQTQKNFEWLIIDDGSVDDTKELIENLSKNSSFPIRYYWKENGGRHTAVNYSYQYLKTKYVVTLDSDDELLPDAIEKMLNTWHSIPEKDYDRFWCISGREMYAHNGEMVGAPYPEGINQLKGKAQRKKILKYPGEKHCCRKVDIHIQYPFPVYSDTKFVTENIVWEQINRKYDQYCVNDIYGKYYVNSEDSLSTDSPHKKTKNRSAYYRDIFYINEMFDEIFFNKSVLLCTVDLPRRALLTDTSYLEVMGEIESFSKKVLVTLCYPLAFLLIKFRDKL